MNKKGVSVVVSVVLLIALSVTLGIIIYSNSLSVIRLSPEVDCYGLDFRAEIVNENGASVLNVVNIGNLPIKGFYVKKENAGEIVLYEEVLHDVTPGATESITLSKQYLPSNYVVVPRVEGIDSNERTFVGACKDLYGLDVAVN